MKIENRGVQCWAALWPTAFGPTWPSSGSGSGMAGPGSPTDKVGRGGGPSTGAARGRSRARYSVVGLTGMGW
jgi:hypothetical protein